MLPREYASARKDRRYRRRVVESMAAEIMSSTATRASPMGALLSFRRKRTWREARVRTPTSRCARPGRIPRQGGRSTGRLQNRRRGNPPQQPGTTSSSSLRIRASPNMAPRPTQGDLGMFAAVLFGIPALERCGFSDWYLQTSDLLARGRQESQADSARVRERSVSEAAPG